MLTTVLAAASPAAHQVLAHGDHWHGPGFFWPIIPIVFWIAVITIVVALRRRALRRGGFHRTGISVLEERFADGTIDEAEYRARLAVLLESRRR